ncbi:MAPEG family protein [Aliidiomarina sp. Khilg15.8]
MIDISDYSSSLLWVGILIAMVFVQWLIASGPKAKQPGAVPGTPPQNQTHADFTFRAWRTHQNTLENLGTMLGAAFFAILVGADPAWVSGLLAIMVVARIAHMVLYYAIATDKNPSPRSYFFLIAWVANLALLICGFIALI